VLLGLSFRRYRAIATTFEMCSFAALSSGESAPLKKFDLPVHLTTCFSWWYFDGYTLIPGLKTWAIVIFYIFVTFAVIRGF
jgi:hypothetical protein